MDNFVICYTYWVVNTMEEQVLTFAFRFSAAPAESESQGDMSVVSVSSDSDADDADSDSQSARVTGSPDLTNVIRRRMEHLVNVRVLLDSELPENPPSNVEPTNPSSQHADVVEVPDAPSTPVRTPAKRKASSPPVTKKGNEITIMMSITL